MTFTASYNAHGEKVFYFPCNIYSNGKFVKPVNNTDYSKLNMDFAPFDENEIVVFEGNDGGIFLTILHENEPVSVLDSFETMEHLQLYLKKERERCEFFNRSLSSNNIFFSYYLLNHTANNCNPESPHIHLLIGETESIEHFHTLYQTYESLYEKKKKFQRAVSFVRDDFIDSLTEEEFSLFKFSIFCYSGDVVLCDSWQESFLSVSPDLKDNAFEFVGIQGSTIDYFFRLLKMNPYYFIFKIRNNSGTPSVFYFDGGVESYLKPEDELILWRSGKVLQEYLTNNFDFIVEVNEPDDHG